MRHVITTEMLSRLEGLLGTKDLNDWEQGFVSGLLSVSSINDLTWLSDKQVETLERLHNKHFA